MTRQRTAIALWCLVSIAGVAAAEDRALLIGIGSYRIEARDEPLDDTYQDNRVELSAAWDEAYSRTLDGEYGARISMEFDYMSIGANTRWRIASDSRDTVWSIAGAASLAFMAPRPRTTSAICASNLSARLSSMR